jgi:hypothetical protein
MEWSVSQQDRSDAGVFCELNLNENGGGPFSDIRHRKNVQTFRFGFQTDSSRETASHSLCDDEDVAPRVRAK